MRRSKTRTLGHMDVLLAAFLSPLAMAVVAAAVVALAKASALSKPKISTLIWMTIAFAGAGAIASLLFTIGWMAWYEKTTGYSAGNGPLGWIFIYGPTSAAVGQFLALVLWWFMKAERGPANAS
jgi:hypothetical protein